MQGNTARNIDTRADLKLVNTTPDYCDIATAIESMSESAKDDALYDLVISINYLTDKAPYEVLAKIDKTVMRLAQANANKRGG